MRHKLLSAALLLGLAGHAHALTDSVINSGLQINFANPGARSLGMGGAFLGFSDDATAAYTNPAGLTNLATPEFAAEGRYTENSIPYVSGGRASVQPNNNSGLLFSDAESEQTTLSYVSYVHPLENVTIAVYRHVLGNYDNLLGQADVFVDSSDNNLAAEIFASGAAIDLSIENYGASLAWKMGDRLSLGIGAIYSQFEFTAVTVRNRGQTEAQRGVDSEWVYNMGLLYQLDDKWSIGAAYRHGADFEVRYFNLDPTTSAIRSAGDTSFDVPHQFGIGVAYRPTEALALGFEANHVRYNRLGNGFTAISFNVPGAASSFEVSAESGTELRLGGEYVFLNMSRPFSVRAGVWRDPDHRLAYDGPQPPDDFGQAAASVLFPQGDDEYHYSLGFGWAFEKFQVDAAADFSDQIDTYSVSGVYRF